MILLRVGPFANEADMLVLTGAVAATFGIPVDTDLIPVFSL